MVFFNRFQQRRDLADHRIIELVDFCRQRVVELRQRLTRAQHAHHLGEVVIGRMRGRVGCELGAGLPDAFGRAERIFEIFYDLGLERGGCLAKVFLLVGGGQLVDLLDIVAGHRRQQVAADPFPDRRQRAARDPAGIFVLGRAVDEHRLQRRKKIPCGIAGATLTGSVRAEFGAQPGLDVGGARHLDAAQLQPFELGEEAIARQRRQSLQKFPNPVDLHHHAQCPQFFWRQRSARRVEAFARWLVTRA